MAVKRKNNTQKRRRMKGGAGWFEGLFVNKPAESAVTKSADESASAKLVTTTANPLVDDSATKAESDPAPVLTAPVPKTGPTSALVAGPVTPPKGPSFFDRFKFTAWPKGGKRLSKKAKAKKSKSKK